MALNDFRKQAEEYRDVDRLAGAKAEAEIAWQEVAATQAFKDARPFIQDLCKTAFIRGFLDGRGVR
jgi:hypothetical protein